MKISVTIGKSSQSTTSNFFHNSREHKHQPKYLLPPEKQALRFKNEKPFWCSRPAQDSINLLENQFLERSEIYKKRTGKKIPSNTKKQFSIVVGISDYEKILDADKSLKLAIDEVQKIFDSKAIQIAKHADEGHIENGETKYNYHAHLEFCNLDGNGKSLTKKCDKIFLQQLQQKTCEVAGANYRKFTEKTRRKNIPHSEFRQLKETEKSLKNEISNLKQKLIETEKATKQDYKLLSEFRKSATMSDYSKSFNDFLSDFINFKNYSSRAFDMILNQSKPVPLTKEKKRIVSVHDVLSKKTELSMSFDEIVPQIESMQQIAVQLEQELSVMREENKRIKIERDEARIDEIFARQQSREDVVKTKTYKDLYSKFLGQGIEHSAEINKLEVENSELKVKINSLLSELEKWQEQLKQKDPNQNQHTPLKNKNTRDYPEPKNHCSPGGSSGPSF